MLFWSEILCQWLFVAFAWAVLFLTWTASPKAFTVYKSWSLTFYQSENVLIIKLGKAACFITSAKVSIFWVAQSCYKVSVVKNCSKCYEQSCFKKHEMDTLWIWTVARLWRDIMSWDLLFLYCFMSSVLLFHPQLTVPSRLAFLQCFWRVIICLAWVRLGLYAVLVYL